jgi:glycosyltransferase involved in cell wall biosynthesis
MKIALIGCWPNMKIYPIYSWNLRNALATLTGQDVTVITTDCMCFDRNNPIDDRFDLVNLPYFTNVPSGGRLKNTAKKCLYPLSEYSRGRLLSRRSGGFDVVDFQQSSYAFGYESLKAFLSSPSRARKIVTIHKLDKIQKEKPQSNQIYNKADGVIVLSDYMKQVLVGGGVEAAKISVVYHGTDLPPQRDLPKEHALLFCGSPIPDVKGFEPLVVALRMLREKGTALKVLVYGFFVASEKEYAIGLARQEGVDDLLEWRSFRSQAELIEAHQRSILCLIPYTGYAGYFPAAYAMGNGVPIVATDALGHSEYMNGSAVLVAPGSPEALADAISRVLADDALREELGVQGRKRAEQSLSWETVASQTLQVFEDALARGGGRFGA